MRSDLTAIRLVRRYVCAAAVILLACFFAGGGVWAQSAESLSEVKRIAVDWPGTEKGSTAVRDRLSQKLAGAGMVVTQEAQADAILHGRATIWVAGYVSMSPKSKSVQQPVYRGYASAEVTGKGGKALWSYLVTPRVVGWRSITDDLADQLAHELLEASKSKGKSSGERAAGTSTSQGHDGATAVAALSGAGATFPAPMYQKWFEDFVRGRPDIQIQYAAVGSEEGIQRLLSGQTDFGATDMPLSREKLNAPAGRVLQIATMVGGVVPIYNVKGAEDGLKLTPEVLAGIFLGKIKRWNAPEIVAINKHAHLPDEEIAVIHRSDGSGTTFVWTDYLSRVSAEWKSRLGAGTTVNWPVGKGAEHNEGVAVAVRDTPNSIGYVEFLYALQHELDFAAVRNASGDFVKADLDSVAAAAKMAVIPENGVFDLSIANASGKHVYPIATFTWLLIPEENRDAAKTAALRDLLRWVLTSGQKQCEGLGYVPLPGEFARQELQALAALH